jgi:hypothetical protein
VWQIRLSGIAFKVNLDLPVFTWSKLKIKNQLIQK